MKLPRKLLRILIWTLISLIFLFIILHTPPVRSLVRGILIRTAGNQINGQIEIGHLSYRLWRGDAKLEDVVFKIPGLQVQAKMVEVALLSKQGISLKIDHPRVVLSPKPKTSEDKAGRDGPSRPWSFLEKLGRVDVNSGRFEWKEDQTKLLVSGSVKLESQNSEKRSQGNMWSLHGDLNCALDNRPQVPLIIEAILALDGGSLRLDPFRVDSNENFSYAKGILHHLSPINGNLEGKFHVDSSLAEVFDLYLPVQGSVTVQFQLEAQESDIEGQVEIDSPSFILAETGPWAVHGKVRLKDWTAHLDSIHFQGYSGSIESQGRIDLSRGNGEAQLLVNGLDLNPLLKTWTDAVPQLATRAGAKLELCLDNWRLDQNKTKGEIRLDPVRESGLPLWGKATLGLDKGKLSFRSDRLQILQGQCNLIGSLDTRGINTTYELSIPASDLQKILEAFQPKLPLPIIDGLISASGNLTGDYRDLSAAASVKADELQFFSEKMSLMADLKWGQDALRVQSASFSSGQGNLEIQGTIPLGKTTGEWDLSAKMESFDLSGFVERLGFTSSADGSFHIKGPSSSPVWTVNFNSKLQNQKQPSQTATVMLNAQKIGQMIAIKELRVDAGGGSLTASGHYRADSGEIKGRLTAFGIRIQEMIELPEALGSLEGVCSLDGDLSGTTQSPQARLDLSLEDLSLNGAPLAAHSLSVRLKEKRAEFRGLGPESFLTGFCELEGSFPTHAELDLQLLPYNSLLVAFPILSKFEDISAKGQIQLDLSLKDISNLKYHADISEIKGAFDKQNWSIDSFSIVGDLVSLRVSRFRYQGSYTLLSLEGLIPLNQYREMDLTLDGRVDLEPFHLFIPELELYGLARLQLRLKGTFNQPLLIGEMSITEGKGHWQGINWDDLELRIKGDKEQILLEALSVKVLNGELRANGNLSLPGSGSSSQITFECDQLDVGVLLDDETDSPPTSVLLNGKGLLSTTELSLSSLNGTGQFTDILTNMGDPQISLQRPFEWTFKGGHFSHSPIRFVGEETDLNISLKISTADTPPDWDIQINGKLDAGAVSKLIPGAETSFSGSTVIDLDLTHRNGALIGQASVNGGKIRFADPPLTISQVQAQLTADGQVLEIVNLKGQVGSGKLEGSGQLQFENIGTLPKADLKFTIEKVPLMLSEDIYALISGETRLQGDPQSYTISGDIIIPRLLYSKEMDSTSESLSQLDRQLKLLEGRSSLSDLITLDLTTHIQDLHIENSLAQLSAEGALSISGSLSNPELEGSISVQGGGSLKLGRARVQISEGRVILNNYPESQLELDISGITRISGVFIELRVQGQLDNLQTQLQAPYRSDLTQGDLVMLIMTGRTSQAAVSEAGTVAVEGLAGALGDVLQEGVGESVYIDVSPDQSFFSYDTDPTTWFSLGKEVAPNIYVIYSQDLGSTRRRGIIGYLPKELPIQLRYIAEEDGRKMIEANHRLAIRLRKKQERGDTSQDPLRINQLSFKGISPLEDKELRKLVKQKTGKKYGHWNALQGAERIRNRLGKLGYRSARIEFEATPSGLDQIDVTYLIESGKRIHIVWKGDQVKGKIRKDIEALWNAATPEDILSETLRRQTEYALRVERFYLAQVEVNRTNTEEEITVELQVIKGPQGQRLVLQFEGNEVLSDKELAATLPSPSKPLFFEAIDGNVSSLRNILRVRYASEGYLQIEVHPAVTKYDGVNREYFVTVPVEEGTLSTLSDITLPQEFTEAKGPDVPDFQLRVGQPFRIEEYLHDRSALSRYYRGLGYAKSRVTGILEPTEDEVSVTFTVTKDIQPRVGKIQVAHPGRTHESVVRNAMTLREGDLILPSEIARSRKRLFDTRVYKSVDIQAVESEEGPEVQDLVVDLVEKQDVEVNYGLRYEISGPQYADNDEVESSNYSSLDIGGRLQLQNPFGYANRFGISGYLFGKQQSARLFFDTETFFGLHLPTQVYLSTEVNRQLEISGLETNIRKIAFQQYYSWGETLEESRWGDRLRFQWNYSFRHIRLDPFDTNLDPVNTDRGSISLSLLSDMRNSFVNPTKGSFWSVSSEFARTWLGSEVNYNKLYGQGFLYVSLAENVIWASGLRLGVVPGENPLLIIEDRFKAGGPSSVRAFPLNSLGPKNERGEPLGGQALVVFNQELRFPLYKSIRGGVFYDTGNVFLLARKARLSDLRHSAGVGLRYLLPFGPIRFDFAYVLDPEQGEKRYRFILTLGHAF